MATKKSVTKNVLKNVDKIKVQAKKINNTFIETSDVLVEESLATGQKWQKVFAKAIENGTVLFGKQQDLLLDTVKTVKTQYTAGSTRFQQLLGIEDTVDFTVKKAKATMKAAAAEVEKLQDKAKENIEAIVEKTEIAVPSIKKAKKKVSAKKVAKKAAKKAAKKVTAKKVVVKKVTAKKATKKVIIVKKDDLTVINGIGPKLAAILNKAGITSYKLLAATDVKTIKNILESAGPRYVKFNPTPWRKAAKLAAAGKLK